MKNIYILILMIVIVFFLASDCENEPGAIKDIPPGTEEIEYTQEGTVGLEISNTVEDLLSGEIGRGKEEGKSALSIFRTSIKSGKIKFGESKKILDAIDKLEEMVKNGLSPNDERVIALRLNLIHWLVGVPISYTNCHNTTAENLLTFGPYSGAFSTLKLDLEKASHRVIPSKKERFEKRRLKFDEECDEYINRIQRNLTKNSDELALDREIRFLNEQIHIFQEILEELIDNHTV